MAIAFYVPPEYGPGGGGQQGRPPPPRPAQQQVVGQVGNQQQQHQIIDMHQHYQQDDNNNNVVMGGGNGGLNNGQEVAAANGDNLPGLDFAWRFIQEVLRACMIISNGNNNTNQSVSGVVGVGGAANDDGRLGPVGDNNDLHNHHPNRLHQRRVQQAQSTRRRHPAQVQNPHHLQQDNQIAPDVVEPLPPVLSPLDLIPRSFRTLPDIVTCHAGMSFRYGSSYPSQEDLIGLSNSNELNHPPTQSPPVNNENRNNSNNNNRERREPVQPLSPTSSQSPVTMDFEVSLKLEMSMEMSQELHQHDDDEDVDEELVVPGGIILSPEEEFRLAGAQLRQIADNFQRTRQQQHQRNQSTFEVNVVISVAVPTVALMAIGFAYLRRS